LIIIQFLIINYFYSRLLVGMRDYSAIDDAALLRLLAGSDPDSFTEIYRRYWKNFLPIPYNPLEEIQPPENPGQDAFSPPGQNRLKSDTTSLENYLAISVKYTIFARIRKQQHERAYIASLPSASIAGERITEALHHKRVLEVVHNEVERLPKKCRLIFKSSRNEGKPVKQIAKELKLSPSTVENQIAKALKQLRLATRSLLH